MKARSILMTLGIVVIAIIVAGAGCRSDPR
jgi:hypothetical protein